MSPSLPINADNQILLLVGTVMGLVLGFGSGWAFFSPPAQTPTTTASCVQYPREVIRFVMRPPFVKGDCIQKETWDEVLQVMEVGKEQFLLGVVATSLDSYGKIGDVKDLPFSLTEYHTKVKCP